MADVKGNKEIKANIIGEGSPINANIVKNDKKIQSYPSVVPTATTERKGIIRIATEEEAIEGISNNIAITPHTLKICTDTYIFEQAIASDVWIINHNLNKCPSIYVVDTAGHMQIPDDIEVNDQNTITVTFLAAFAGYAYLN